MWSSILEEISRTFFLQIYKAAIDILLIFILLLVGFFASLVLKLSVVKGLKTLRLDELSYRVGLVKILEKGGIKHSISELIGVICYWIGILTSLVIAFNLIGLTAVAELLNRLIFYLPNVIVSIFVLVLGIIASNILKNVVKTLASNSGIKQADILGKITEVAIVIFATLTALEQLKIRVEIIEMAIGILLASIGLAFALAFGLGCAEITGKSIYEKIEEMKQKKQNLYKERR